MARRPAIAPERDQPVDLAAGAELRDDGHRHGDRIAGATEHGQLAVPRT
jgi:hypothetical protein